MTTDRKTEPCPACTRQIFFLESTATAAKIPLDARPIQSHVYGLASVGTPDEKCTPLKELLPAERFFISHYATCTDPARFSQRPRA